MAGIDFASLRNDPFWRKKFTRFLEVTDLDNDGYVSRADYDIYVTRYKSLSTAPSLQVLAKVVDTLCAMWGLEGPKKLSYAEVEELFLNDVGKQILAGKLEIQLYSSMFDSIDANDDDFIDFAEWRIHCECLGIPVEHAKASFDAIDTNHDGLLSRKKFSDYHFEFFFTAEDKLRSSILYGPLD